MSFVRCKFVIKMLLIKKTLRSMKNFTKVNLIILSILILSFCFQTISAQTYYFVQVQGKISSGGSTLAKGSKVSASSKIKIAPGAKAVVMSSTSGRFVLPKPGTVKASEFEDILTNVISPLKTNGQASTRGAEDEIVDLAFYFTEGQFAVLSDTLTFQLDEATYPLEVGKSFVAFSYKYNGKSISKVIPFEGNLVTLDKKLLFVTKSGEPVPAEDVEKVTVYYFKDYQAKDKVKLTTFKPIFVDLEELKGDLDFLTAMEEYQAETDDTGRYYHIYRFVRDVYGKVSDELTLKNWLVENAYLSDNSIEFDEDRDKANQVGE